MNDFSSSIEKKTISIIADILDPKKGDSEEKANLKTFLLHIRKKKTQDSGLSLVKLYVVLFKVVIRISLEIFSC